MRIAKLQSDGRYQGLVLNEAAGNPPMPIESTSFHSPESIRVLWQPVAVTYFNDEKLDLSDTQDTGNCSQPGTREPLRGDFPHFWSLNHGVLTQRSYDKLHNLLEPFVEFLPLSGPEEEAFFAFKVLRFVDALDETNSEIEWFPQLKRDFGKPRMARRIKKHAFREEILDKELLFRIPQMPTHNHVFVTSRFIDAVCGNSLIGFNFLEVWPIPAVSNEHMRYVAKRLRRTRRS